MYKLYIIVYSVIVFLSRCWLIIISEYLHGFFRLAEIAEQLQFAAEKNDIDFVNSTHKDMMELYKNILTATKQFLIDTTHS